MSDRDDLVDQMLETYYVGEDKDEPPHLRADMAKVLDVLIDNLDKVQPKSSTAAEKAIRGNFAWLRDNGMSVFALDLAQEVEASLLKRIHIGKYHKSSYAAKKDGDWEALMDECERVAAILHRLPKKWQEVALERFIDMVVKGPGDE